MNQVEEIKRGLGRLADDLDQAPRHGAPIDNPEGIRWIQMSDTACRHLSGLLRGLSRNRAEMDAA